MELPTPICVENMTQIDHKVVSERNVLRIHLVDFCQHIVQEVIVELLGDLPRIASECGWNNHPYEKMTKTRQKNDNCGKHPYLQQIIGKIGLYTDCGEKREYYMISVLQSTILT